MTRRFKAHENSSGDVEAQHPVPYGRSTCLVELLRKDVLCALEAIGLGNGNGEPDHVEQKVEDDDAGSEAKDGRVRLGGEVVHADADAEESLGDDPLHSAEFDVVGVGGEGEVEHRDLRQQEVCGSLAVGGDKRGPSSGAPPSDNEAKEPAITATTGFRGPEVDGAGCRQSGADFCENGGCDEDEDTSDYVARPRH